MNRAERKEAGEALKGILAAPDRVQAVNALENAGFGKTDWLKAELKSAQGLLAERNAEIEKLRATIRQLMKDLMR